MHCRCFGGREKVVCSPSSAYWVASSCPSLKAMVVSSPWVEGTSCDMASKHEGRRAGGRQGAAHGTAATGVNTGTHTTGRTRRGAGRTWDAHTTGRGTLLPTWADTHLVARVEQHEAACAVRVFGLARLAPLACGWGRRARLSSLCQLPADATPHGTGGRRTEHGRHLVAQAARDGHAEVCGVVWLADVPVNLRVGAAEWWGAASA